ncbi:MAG: ABC transporter permease [Alicyclobacillus sp.]|nr:ABC transporter permease [Alicyclobacillus sp.]
MHPSPSLDTSNQPSQPSDLSRMRRRSVNMLLRSMPLWRNRKAVAGLAIIVLFVIFALLAPVLTHIQPDDNGFLPSQPPGPEHWLGTTSLGQDVFSQFVWGTRSSLTLGLLAGLGTTVLSVIVVLISGYFAGWIDEFLQLVTNVFLIIPGLPLMIVLAAIIPFGGDWPIIMVVVITGWAWGARVFRSQILTMRSLPYVESAVMAGESGLRVVFRELFPNMISLIFANFLFNILYAILSASGLQFLGLGDLKIIDWGTILYWADTEGAILQHAWWWFVPAGAAIALLGAGLSLLNYAIDELTNPKLRTRAKRRRKQRQTQEVASA